MFTPSHRIRWKRDLELEVTTEWSQDTGLSRHHAETRAEGQEEDVSYYDNSRQADVQMHFEKVSSYYDQSWGRMAYAVSRDEFDVLHTY